MKINMDSVMTAFDGQPLMDKDAKGNPFKLTVKVVILEGLLRVHISDERLSGMEKMKRFDLAKRVFDAKDMVEITPEEVVMLKDVIGLKLPVLIVGQMYKILDGK